MYSSINERSPPLPSFSINAPKFNMNKSNDKKMISHLNERHSLKKNQLQQYKKLFLF
jgi:hypothetical protein